MPRGALPAEAGVPTAYSVAVISSSELAGNRAACAAIRSRRLTDHLGHKPLLDNSCPIAPADNDFSSPIDIAQLALGPQHYRRLMASGIDDTWI